jgi:EpsI family protein
MAGVQEPPPQGHSRRIRRERHPTRAYFAGSGGVGLHRVYQSQRQGDTVHSPLSCLRATGSVVEICSVTSTQSDGLPREIEINRYLIRKGVDKQLVLYWYQAHNRVVASEYWGKFYLIADAVRMNRTDGSLVRVIAPIATGADGESTAEAAAVRFVKSMFPVLSNFLPA